MNRRRVLAIAVKEMMHILRDPFVLGLALGLPLIMVLLFGFAINFDFKNVPVAVYDFDNTRLSRQLVSGFATSGYFAPRTASNAAAPIDEVTAEHAFAALVITPGFSRAVRSGAAGAVQLLLDGSDNVKAGLVGGYCAGIVGAFNRNVTKDEQGAAAPARVCRVRFLYNPELNTSWFIVPGLMVVMTGLLSILLTALTIAREWENGSMELLLSTPVSPLEIIVGKIIPYIVLVLMGMVFVYGAARVVFGVPFEGNHLFLAVTCLLFIAVSLGQGILISTIANSQQQAMQLAFISGMLPALLLSGFIFPIENMPPFFHYFTMILPPRWFVTIIRGIFLKGAGIIELAVPVAVLAVMMLVVITVAVTRSKHDLE